MSAVGVRGEYVGGGKEKQKNYYNHFCLFLIPRFFFIITFYYFIKFRKRKEMYFVKFLNFNVTLDLEKNKIKNENFKTFFLNNTLIFL